MNAELRRQVARFRQKHEGVVDTLVPEAMGIDVIRTVQLGVGWPIEQRPEKRVFKIALVCYGKEQRID